MDTHRVGQAFEAMAEAMLVDGGWHVLERNLRFGRKEIDLVVRRGAVVAFVEVKGRRGSGFGHPLEAITALKRREIEAVARWWLARFREPGVRYRFDAVAVVAERGAPIRITHVEDAWRPGWR